MSHTMLKHWFLLLCWLVIESGLRASTCHDYDLGNTVGRIESKSLGKDPYGRDRKGFDEISGLTGSVKNPEIFWMQEDGSTPYIEAISRTGERLGRFRMGVDGLRDVEDMSRGTFKGQHALFVADIGNNRGSRSELSIHVFLEPTIDLESSYADIGEVKSVKTIRYHYPDYHRFDAESMSVCADGWLYIIRKDGWDGRHDLYRLPEQVDYLDDESKVEAEFVCQFDSIDPRYVVTAAEISPVDNRMIIRAYNPRDSYNDHILYEYSTSEEGISSICDGDIKRLSAVNEGQGEAVTYSVMDGSIFHVSEGWSPNLNALACKPFLRNL